MNNCRQRLIFRTIFLVVNDIELPYIINNGYLYFDEHLSSYSASNPKYIRNGYYGIATFGFGYIKKKCEDNWYEKHNSIHIKIEDEVDQIIKTGFFSGYVDEIEPLSKKYC